MNVFALTLNLVCLCFSIFSELFVYPFNKNSKENDLARSWSFICTRF